MDSDSRAFERLSNLIPFRPPRRCLAPASCCPRPSRCWTPYRILGAMLMLLLAVPRTLVLVPATIRRRA